ncbi:MAG TPA: S41 family peptidase [Myxococcales bacterium]|jgi:carboxyl-terminal processing protease|nr:S41 family peptidase [Myxococcales bacterium]
MQKVPPPLEPPRRSRARRFALLFVTVFAVLGIVRVARAAADPAGPYRKLDVFSHVLSLIQNNYVEDVDDAKLLYGAIEGMVRTLDPHSTFMEPKAYAALKQETDGEYGGVGVEIAVRGDDIVVVTPIDDTPASRAGLAPGDKLLEIDGAQTRGWKEIDGVKALMGAPGTTCVLKVARASWPEPRTMTLVRDVVRVVSVESRLYDHRFGYVKIKNFQDRTDVYLKKALDSLRAQAGGPLAGVVLDLRHNPGGLLEQAVKVADRFLYEGVIVTTKGRGGKHVEVERAHPKDTEPSYPMIVLVDGGTASASEIVAGALQDHGRAVVMGTQTFGKGSVQTVIELEDGSGLKLTIARYYTPNGRSIQEKGITPDLFVRQQSGPAVSEDDSPRERNLPNHFKAEEAAARVMSASAAPLPNLPQQPGDPSDDFQLKTALDTLRTWQIFRAALVGTASNATSSNASSHP